MDNIMDEVNEVVENVVSEDTVNAVTEVIQSPGFSWKSAGIGGLVVAGGVAAVRFSKPLIRKIREGHEERKAKKEAKRHGYEDGDNVDEDESE